MREIPFATIQFPLWEHLKDIMGRFNRTGKCEPSQSAVCGALAGEYMNILGGL